MKANKVNAHQPIIVHSDMTDRWYIATRYTVLGDGKFVASKKHDVTDEMNKILNDYAAKANSLMIGSPTEIVLERLATLEHEQWIKWSKTLVEQEPAITQARRERWAKLWVPFNELSEEQKERDREWARKALTIVQEYF